MQTTADAAWPRWRAFLLPSRKREGLGEGVNPCENEGASRIRGSDRHPLLPSPAARCPVASLMRQVGKNEHQRRILLEAVNHQEVRR